MYFRHVAQENVILNKMLGLGFILLPLLNALSSEQSFLICLRTMDRECSQQLVR